MITTATLLIVGILALALAFLSLGAFLFASFRRERMSHRSPTWAARTRKVLGSRRLRVLQRELDLKSRALEGLVF